jgi:hypothetical protein
VLSNPITQKIISEIQITLDDGLYPDKDVYQLCEDREHVVVRRYRDYGAVDCWKWGYETKDVKVVKLSEISQDIYSKLLG